MLATYQHINSLSYENHEQFRMSVNYEVVISTNLSAAKHTFSGKYILLNQGFLSTSVPLAYRPIETCCYTLLCQPITLRECRTYYASIWDFSFNWLSSLVGRVMTTIFLLSLVLGSFLQSRPTKTETKRRPNRSV